MINNSKYFIEFLKSVKDNDKRLCRKEISKLSPLGRILEYQKYEKYAIKSSVMLIFTKINKQIFLLFIERAKDNKVHSGQIAFPGGRFDEKSGDKTAIDTAIRETFEEIRCEIKKENIHCELSPIYVPPSNFWVNPFVAYIDKLPKLQANISEVNKIMLIPLCELLSENIIMKKKFITINGEIDAPCYAWKEISIWGATAMILREMLCLINNANQKAQ